MPKAGSPLDSRLMQGMPPRQSEASRDRIDPLVKPKPGQKVLSRCLRPACHESVHEASFCFMVTLTVSTQPKPPNTAYAGPSNTGPNNAQYRQTAVGSQAQATRTVVPRPEEQKLILCRYYEQGMPQSCASSMHRLPYVLANMKMLLGPVFHHLLL